MSRVRRGQSSILICWSELSLLPLRWKGYDSFPKVPEGAKKQHEECDIDLEELGLESGWNYCDFRLFKKEARKIMEMISGNLDGKSCELNVVSPLRDGVAIIGDIEKLFPPYAIQETYYHQESIEIASEVKDHATIACLCGEPKELTVDGKPCDWVIEGSLLKIKIAPGKHKISIKL